MRKELKYIFECLHILLIFSIILPVLYMLGMQRVEGVLVRLYFLGYLMILPMIFLKWAVRKSRNVLLYLVACVVAIVSACVIALGVGRLLLPGEVRVGYLIYMVVGVLFISIEEYSVRMNRIRQKKAREQMDSSFRQKEYALDKPHFYVCTAYVMIYLVALHFNCPEVCDLSIMSFFLYLMIAVSYQFIESTEKYLSINDEVCHVRNIPYKRIFGIGKYFLLCFLLVILLAVIPTVLTIPYRRYKDIREWIQEREVDYEELLKQEAAHSGGKDPMADVVLSYSEPKEMPIPVKMIFYAIGLSFLIAILYAVIRWIKEEIRDFKSGVDEDGDIVEALVPEAENIVVQRRGRAPKTEEEQIRREYRRFIRKNRKDCPSSYETPREIEVLAGVADTPEGKMLHNKYEEARYGKKSDQRGLDNDI